MGSLNENSLVTNAPTTYLVTLNSAIAQQPAGNFYVSFTRPLDLSQGNWSVAMVDLAVWNTAYNISDTFTNRTFRFSANAGASWVVCTLVPGVYNAPALIQAITDAITNAPGGGPTVATNIALTINTSQITFNLTLGAGNIYRFDPSNNGTSNLYINLGAGKNVVYSTVGTTIFPNQANMSNSVTNYTIRTNVVGSSYANGQASSILYNFVPAVAPGALYYIAPAFPVFTQVNQQSISGIQIQVTDSLGRVIDLNSGVDNQNNPTNIGLLFRKN